eukprot:927871_1
MSKVIAIEWIQKTIHWLLFYVAIHVFSFCLWAQMYKIYCLVTAPQVLPFPTLMEYFSSLIFLSLSKVHALPITIDQYHFFVSISAFEIADGIIRKFVTKTLSLEMSFHHVLHMIAYTGIGLIFTRLPVLLIIHLSLTEWKDLCFWALLAMNMTEIKNSVFVALLCVDMFLQ